MCIMFGYLEFGVGIDYDVYGLLILFLVVELFYCFMLCFIRELRIILVMDWLLFLYREFSFFFYYD